MTLAEISRIAPRIDRARKPTPNGARQFVYVDLGEAEIDATLFSGEYETNRILFFGLYSKWRW